MRIDKSFMLEKFHSADVIRFFETCLDITLAGDDYKITDIIYFIKDELTALDDYIQIKHYDDSFLLIYAHTRNPELFSECVAYVSEHKDDFDEIVLSTPFSEISNNDALNKQFSLAAPSYPANPVYYIHSPSELSDIRLGENVSIALGTECDREELRREAELGNINTEEFGPEIFNTYDCYRDTRLYIMRVDGRIIGYLRAECGYENIYDIGWLYVMPEYRGYGYAAQLVMHFSRDCFDNGLIPHYGYAVSPESARVAEKCGY